MRSDNKKKMATCTVMIVLGLSAGCTINGKRPLADQKTKWNREHYTIGKSPVFTLNQNEMTPELLKEFDQKSQEWPHIRQLYKEGYFDSVVMNNDLVGLLFKDPQGIGDIYFVWGRSSIPQVLKEITGLFWVSYSENRPYTDIKDGSDIQFSEKALTLVPVPVSPVISSIHVEGRPIEPLKTHGDLWFTTWADDNNLYCSWGDGAGIGRGPYTDMGIGCITGTLPDITGVTRYRDSFSEKDDLSQNNKPSSLLFFDGRLYAQVHSPLGDPTVGYLAYSDDYGETWKRAEGESPWNRKVNSNFRCLFFVNMGKNYRLNTDGYVYAFGIGKEWGWEKGVYMARVPKTEILDYNAYEYLVDVKDVPYWSSSQFDARPLPGLFTRDQASAMYHPGIERFLLLTSKDVFDAPTPWGPWTYAGSWARPPPEGWIGGYQPGIISKDTGKDYFWFTIAGQPQIKPWDGTEVKYSLNVGKMIVKSKLRDDSYAEVDQYGISRGLAIVIVLAAAGAILICVVLTRRSH